MSDGTIPVPAAGKKYERGEIIEAEEAGSHEEQAGVQGLRYRGAVMRAKGWGILCGILRRGA